MRAPLPVMRTAVWVVLASVAGLGCDASVDTSLEQKECTRSGECLPGWECSEDQICERVARVDPQGSAPDAGAPDADGGIVTAPEPTSPAFCLAGTACDGVCVDVIQDADNCGACGKRCPGDDHGRAVCTAGTCGLTCSESYTRCGDGCYRLNDDPQHCGSCSFSCPIAQNGSVACVQGMCRATCNEGFSDCGGVCLRTATDALNCGACGHACSGDQRCANGKCVKTCPADSVECSHSCVDPKTDPTNCGSCGTACPAASNASAVCAGGMCGTQCSAGFMACNNACLDVQTDVMNCGGCGKACPAAARRSHAVCAAGSCGTACDMGFVACQDQCISQALADTFNGRTTCAALAMTQDALMCQGMGPNTTYCSGVCVNVNTNKQNCGRCGRACTASQYCYNGTCF
jgi:hypothetical protein